MSVYWGGPIAYYNEFDPAAAAWLRELIQRGLIAPGVVDERSIEDVKPEELEGFTQCHFFAGIGVWSYALRLAGWPDNRPIWTASCPCQPFSSSGRKAGFDDERHLWPALHHLIREYGAEYGAPVVVGEQVASKATGPWFDLVQTDLEALGYAFGCVPFPSAGVGAPHIRDRAYWVAYSSSQGLEGLGSRYSGASGQRETEVRSVAEAGELSGMADSRSPGPLPGPQAGIHSGEDGAGARHGESERPGTVSGLADGDSIGRVKGCQVPDRSGDRSQAEKLGQQHGDSSILDNSGSAGPVNGFWRDSDWLFCRDEKWRPVEPRSFPLAHGAPARVGRLRGYGNAINAEAAKVFIQSVTECIE